RRKRRQVTRQGQGNADVCVYVCGYFHVCVCLWVDVRGATVRTLYLQSSPGTLPGKTKTKTFIFLFKKLCKNICNTIILRKENVL
uniref:Uncharacterized protein n=1 Tax=Dicentrarchus labrax TaxID=13489 RepID=A0A8P4GGB1_DICLA